MFAYFRAPVGWIELARRTARQTYRDDCAGLAAQLAFYFFLALFPALLVFVSVLVRLPIESGLPVLTERLDALLPPAAAGLVREHVEAIRHGGYLRLLTLSAAGALWSASSAMMAIIGTLNRTYSVDDARSWWRTRLTAIALTVALGVFGAASLVLVVGGHTVGQWAAGAIGAGTLSATAWSLLFWPLAFALSVLAVDLVYRFAPNAGARWVWLTPGSLLATSLWIAVSYGFKVYVRNFSNFNLIYGVIGSGIILLLWLYGSGFALLVGAELDAEIRKTLRE